jgi:hypothetical protein
MVPTRESSGRSTRDGFGGGGGGLATVTAAAAGGGGRRDQEKIGRSRVFDSVTSGIAQSGLALRARSGTGGGVDMDVVQRLRCTSKSSVPYALHHADA